MALPPVQYVRRSDGYDIAYRAVGSGPTLVFIPAPLIALGIGTGLTTTVLAGKGLTSVFDRFGAIPTNLLVFTPPGLPDIPGYREPGRTLEGGN